MAGPLVKLSRPVFWFNILGWCPFRINSNGIATTSLCLEMSKVPILFLLAFINNFLLQFQAGLSVEEFNQKMTEVSGMTNLDMSSSISMILATFVMCIANIVMGNRYIEKLNQLNVAFEELPSSLDKESAGKKSLKQAFKLFKWLAWPMFGFIIAGVWFNQLIFNSLVEEPNDYIYVVFVASYPLYSTFAFPGLLLGMYIFVHFWLAYILEYYNAWIRDMEEQTNVTKLKQNKGKQSEMFDILFEDIDKETLSFDNDDIKEQILQGKRLCKLTEDVNTVLSPFLFVQYIFSIVINTFSCFCYFSFFFDDVSWFRIAFALIFSQISIFIYLFFAFTCRAGQKVEDVRLEANCTLQKMVQPVYDSLDCMTKQQLQHLMENLDSGCPISPLAFFDLNNRGLLGGTSAILTYVIVLMQFRAM